ncbi:predicted protein, partial [Thalassiosira pseudonana CCMP1335]
LSASNNKLEGGLPPEISHLSSLSTLRLRNNSLGGTLPSSFNLLSSLTTLDLSWNRNDGNVGITGPLLEFAELSALTRLDLSHNSFSGPIPDFFLARIDIFTGLTEVYASSCGMRGEFPSAILQLSSLERLDISFNECHGTLPSNIGSSLQSMQLLALHHNSFSGSLPSSLGEMRSLHFLQLQANQFVGAIPAAISDMTGLITLNLSDQKSKGGGLTGSLPGFSAMPDLKVLDLSNNYLHSEIPSNFLAMTNINNVDSLDVSSNEIRGENDFHTIPLEVFEVITLQQLFMGTNSFASAIPTSVGNLKQLQLFSCSSSSLSSSIPSEI